MSVIVKLLAEAVIKGQIRLEDVGNNFGLHDKVKKRVEEIKAEEA